jgi:hypothetical protein
MPTLTIPTETPDADATNAVRKIFLFSFLRRGKDLVVGSMITSQSET